MQQIENLEFLNPNRPWVMKELDKLYQEWLDWEKVVSQIIDKRYDRNTQSEVFADGEEMMQKHEILQAKTLTFLNNNIKGHGFIEGFDGKRCDRYDLRLNYRVKHRLQSLRVLIASLEYARVPESYWKQKGKELLDKIIDKAPDAAIDVVANYLKNPMGEG
jgi:hypothetical protein